MVWYPKNSNNHNGNVKRAVTEHDKRCSCVAVTDGVCCEQQEYVVFTLVLVFFVLVPAFFTFYCSFKLFPSLSFDIAARRLPASTPLPSSLTRKLALCCFSVLSSSQKKSLKVVSLCTGIEFVLTFSRVRLVVAPSARNALEDRFCLRARARCRKTDAKTL